MAIQLDIRSNSQQAKEDIKSLQRGVDNIQKGVGSKPLNFSVSKDVNNSLIDISNNVRKIGLDATNATSKVSKLTDILIKVTSLAIGASAFTRLADSITNLESRLKLVTASQGQFNKALRDVSKIAVSSRAPIQTVAELYQKISYASINLGASQKEVGVVVQGVARAIAVSGVEAQQASAAILQLGQALSSGRLQGDELRSILENAPALAGEIAAGLGVTIGQMRLLGAEGKLTSKEVFDAIYKRTNDINSSFKKMGVTYSQAFTNLGNAFYLSAVAIKRSFFDGTGGIPEYLNKIATQLAGLADNFDNVLFALKVDLVIFANQIVRIFGSIPNTIKQAIEKSRDTLGQVVNFIFKVKEIDIESVFPKLSIASEYVKKFVKTIDNYFFWLYDRVIGNSWIPDLVEGITYWFSTLMTAPAFYIKKFVDMVDRMFKDIAESSFGQSLKTAFKTALESSKPIFEEIRKLALKVKFGLTNNKLIDALKQALSLPNKRVQEAAKLRNDEQRDFYQQLNRPVPKRVLDTAETDKVQYGPKRDKENRPFGHDLVQSLPEYLQIPAIAAVAAVAAGAVLMLFKGNSPVISVLTNLINTGFGLAVVRNVNTDQISKTAGDITTTFLAAANKIVKLFFGEGVFGDKGILGALAVMARMSLLWKSGRDFMMDVAKVAVSTPTRMTSNLGNKINAAYVGVKANYSDDSLKYASSALEKIQQNAKVTTTALDKAGQALSQAQASVAYNARGGRIGPSPQLLATLTADLAKATAASRKSDFSVLNQERVVTGLQKNNDSIKSVRDSINKQIAETRDKSRQATLGAFAGAGGALGSLYGFNMGEAWAEQLTKASAWQKVGVVIASTFAGQAIFSGIGYTIGAAFLGVFNTIGNIALWGVGLGKAISLAIIGAFGIGVFALGVALTAGVALLLAWLIKPEWVESAFATTVDWFTQLFEDGPTWIEELKSKINNLTEAIIGWKPFDEKGEQAESAKVAANRAALLRMERERLEPDYPPIGARMAVQADKTVEFTPAAKVALARIPEIDAELASLREKNWEYYKGLLPLSNLDDWLRSKFDAFFKAWGESVIKNNMGGAGMSHNYASGGFIKGPGSSTSDSISAMLSDGEFVVNAKSAKKNKELLYAINQGLSLPGYALGTPPTSKEKQDYIEYAKKIAKDQGVDPNLVVNIFNIESRWHPEARAEGPNTHAVGISQMQPREAKNLGLQNIGNANDDRLNPWRSMDAGILLLKQLQTQFKTRDPAILAAAYHAGPPAVTKAIEQGGGKFDVSKLPLAETRQYLVNLGYSDSAVGTDEKVVKDKSLFGKLKTSEGRSEIGDKISEFFRPGLNKLGGINANQGRDASNFDNSNFDPLENDRVGGQLNPSVIAQLLRGDLELANLIKDATGLDVREKTFEELSPSAFESVLYAAQKWEDATREFKVATNSIGKLIATSRQKEASQLLRQALPQEQIVDKTIIGRLNSGVPLFTAVSEAIQSVGMTVEITADNIRKASKEEVEKLSDTFKQLARIEKEYSENQNWWTGQVLAEGKERTRKMVKNFQEALRPKDSAKEVSANAQKAGTDFASNYQDALSAGIAQVFRGKQTVSGFLRSAMDILTAGIVDSFSKGLVDSLFSGFKLKDLFSSLITSQYSLGEKVGKKLSPEEKIRPDINIDNPFSSVKSPFDYAYEGTKPELPFDYAYEGIASPLGNKLPEPDQFASGLSKLATAFTDTSMGTSERLISAVGGLGDIFKGGIGDLIAQLTALFSSMSTSSLTSGGGGSGIGGFFSSLFGGGGGSTPTSFDLAYAFADGGVVPGPLGAATLATVHGGEMVLNAAQQRDLLGGKSGSNTSVFNLNITGDVSRQTRSEIQRMIPQIAGGVNQHNYEKGVR